MKGQRISLNDFISKRYKRYPQRYKTRIDMADLGNLEFWRSLERLYRTRVRSYQEKTCEYARHDQCKGWIKSRCKGN